MTFVQMLVFWSIFLAVLPGVILRFERHLGWSLFALDQSRLRWTGASLFAVAGVLGLHSAWVMAVAGQGTPLPFDCPRRLVLRGAYRYLRNPMAVAGLSQGAAVGLYLGSWAVLLYTAAGFVLWNYLVRRWEEDDLQERFGIEYERYRAEVKCWWPRYRAYEPPEGT